MTTPEQDHPDRLPEIKQRYSLMNDTSGDAAWLIGEVERLRAALAYRGPVIAPAQPWTPGGGE